MMAMFKLWSYFRHPSLQRLRAEELRNLQLSELTAADRVFRLKIALEQAQSELKYTQERVKVVAASQSNTVAQQIKVEKK